MSFPFWNRITAASLLGLSLISTSWLAAQTPAPAAASPAPAADIAPPAALPVFSVVSIKPNKLEGTFPSFTFKPTGLSIRKYAPLWLLYAAYDLVEDRRVINSQPWMLSEFYDIEAKVDEADMARLAKMTKQEQLPLLQQIFETRFNLKYHYETRDFKIFDLVVAKGGPKSLVPTKFNDSNIRWRGDRNYDFEDISMPELCLHSLSKEAKLLVVDKTGLTGRYDFSLKFSREGDVVDGAPSEQPLIFTAVQEQLGLKMIPSVAATKVMVIDHIERPSDNL